MQLRFLPAVVTLIHVAFAQGQEAQRPASAIIVSGMVHDSIANKPLAGATVQLVGAGAHADFARTATTDSSGIFSLADIPDGNYVIGFFHPVLDSLGVEPPAREVRIEGQKPTRADLAIPSPRSIRRVICGPQTGSDSSGVVVGTVRDASNGSPLSRVTVLGEWLEFSIMRGGIARRVPRLVAVTGDNGWFAICRVPSAGTMTLMASRYEDSTDVIDVQIPPEGFVRRELYLGHATTTVTRDSAPARDSLALAPRRLHTGNGRLSGTVVAANGGRPLAGALVGVVDGPQVRANQAGEWTITDAPSGSRMLEIRAVGYYPERRRVDVIDKAPPVKVALATLQSVLDTVKILASSARVHDMQGFLQRRKIGPGRYLTREDVARRGGVFMSDVLRTVPGLSIERVALGESMLLMRGAFGLCAPDVYINGFYMNLGPDDLDQWVPVKEIVGIEVYAGDTVPPQFQRAMTGCGTIVIWTK